MQHIGIEEEKKFRRFFGKRLLSARRAANLSQKGLAYHLGTGQDTISNYERGKVIPSMLTLYNIAETLEVNVNYFFPDKRFANLTAEDQETLALISSLSPAAYQFILLFMQYTLENQLRKHYYNRCIDPIALLERLINGNLHTVEAENKALYILLGLCLLLFEGCQLDKLSLKKTILLQRIVEEKSLLRSIVAEILSSRSQSVDKFQSVSTMR